MTIQDFKMFIDGEWVTSSSNKKIETFNPENNEVWATVPEANEEDVDKAVKAAQRAFEKTWGNLHPTERGKYLRAIADQLRQNAEHLGRIETIDTGKLYRETKTQANYIAEYYDYFAGLADKVEGTVVPIDKPNMQVTTVRIPIGVVAAIIPWNSQMLLTAVKLAPALAMGNTVVIKASELAPVTLLEFAKLIQNAGIPKGVVNVITGLGEPCGRARTTHNLVERIAFTGGPETAKHIIKNSAENLSQVSLELGGKSPVVVFDELIKKAKKIKLSGPMNEETQMGPLNSFKQLENIEKNIKATVEQGGKIRCGGKRSDISDKGYYFPATIIECDNHNLPTAENELFGPILSVMKFNNEDEVINKMNDNKYGLSSGVYTSNFARGHRMSRAIRAGIVFINTYRLISPMAPFGGIKDSGYGKEAGIESIKDYTRIKTIWSNTSDKPMSDPFTMG